MAVKDKIVLFFSVCGISLFPCLAHAEPVPLSDSGVQLSATGGEVTVTFAGSEAAFDHLLWQSEPSDQGPYFPSHSTTVGSSQSLGMFLPGTELAFMLEVLTTGNHFFTGPASSNPDGIVHAIAQPFSGSPMIAATGILVGFEDMLGGGDMDFNDFSFVVSNVMLKSSSPIPEPATMLLVGSGLAMAVRASRRGRGKRRQA